MTTMRSHPGKTFRMTEILWITLYRRTLDSDISAELCAASASFAEMAAVSAGVPQLGASLPSPQARGL
jgi:hypothetical protein